MKKAVEKHADLIAAQHVHAKRIHKEAEHIGVNQRIHHADPAALIVHHLVNGIITVDAGIGRNQNRDPRKKNESPCDEKVLLPAIAAFHCFFRHGKIEPRTCGQQKYDRRREKRNLRKEDQQCFSRIDARRIGFCHVQSDIGEQRKKETNQSRYDGKPFRRLPDRLPKEKIESDKAHNRKNTRRRLQAVK